MRVWALCACLCYLEIEVKGSKHACSVVLGFAREFDCKWSGFWEVPAGMRMQVEVARMMGKRVLPRLDTRLALVCTYTACG